MVQFSHPYITTRKIIALTIQTFVGKVLSLLFNMLSKLVIAFLPSSKSFNLMATITVCSDFGAQEKKICHCFHFSPFYLPWSNETKCHDLSFLNVEFQNSFFTLFFHLQQALCFLLLGWNHLHIWSCWYFSWQSWFQLVIHLARHFTWCTLHRS